MNKLLAKLVKKENLTSEDVENAMELLVSGQLTEAVGGALLLGLAMKGETVEEIMSVVKVMRRRMIPVSVAYPVLDTCGTGGDGANTFNVSTAAAFVAAASGIKVAKHGNRSVSSKSGSMDVLEALGINIQLTPCQAKQCLDTTGITFLFAPLYHPTMKHIAPIRKALGIRTIFNFVGPLLNPAGAAYQVVGVSSSSIAERIGEVLMALGSKKVLVVHSEDSLDEISIAAPTTVYEYVPNSPARVYTINPEYIFSLEKVKGGAPMENAAIISNILQGKGTPAQREFVALNTGAALVAAGAAENIPTGKQRAYQIIDSGAAYDVLQKVITFTKNI